MTEHRNVVHFAEVFNEVCQILPSDRVFHGFALGFDGSVEEMCMAYANGACLVVGTTDIAQLGNDASHYFVEMGVTVFSTAGAQPSDDRATVREIRALRQESSGPPPPGA